METATHINDLLDDILAKILWHCEESTPWKPESDALWSRHSLSPKPRYLRSIVLDKDPSPEEEDSYPVSYPSAIPTAAKIFLVSSVCRRWRDVAQRNISTLLVERKQAISLQQLSNVVACFPNLTHLHLCDDSVETLDDSFLAHLASSCPQLKILHVGRGITHHPDYVGPKHKHPITEAGLDRFFQRSAQLEQLSLLCLHRDVHLPASFFHLTRLHTLALTAASALEAPDLETLASLTTLHIASPELNEEQLANVRRLPSITSVSLSAGPTFDVELLSDWPLSSLEWLQISDCRELEQFPDSIAELLPRLRELTVSRCEALEELPEGVCSLEHLETLSIINCEHFSCLPENIGSLTALKTLVLGTLLLAFLPDSVCQLSSLETFFVLSCDSICELPADFCCLTALTTLCLGHVALPADIGRLRNLHTLLLRDSYQSRHLPSTWLSLSLTPHLNLAGVAEELPFPLTFLSRLRTLIIDSAWSLQRLPADIGSALPQLRKLKLVNAHELRELPASVAELENLTVLVCYARKLASLPHAIGALSRLRELHLIGCEQLEQLPASLTQLACLNKLSILNSPIRSLCSNAAQFTRLRSLDLSGCAQLEALPGDLSELKALQELKLFRCGLVKDTDGSVLPRSINELYGLKIYISAGGKLYAKVGKTQMLAWAQDEGLNGKVGNEGIERVWPEGVNGER
ncbi:unnamed protein product [Closterium sp. NIES-65]|nr:unnamed protein product [Closterium sp. NIES-65]